MAGIVIRLTYGPRTECVELQTASMTELCTHVNRLFGSGNYWVLYHLEKAGGNWEVLHRLKDKRELANGIELLCVRYPMEEQNEQSQACHVLQVRSYSQVTPCAFCGRGLWGAARQGLYCQGCNRNFHKHCVYHSGNVCLSDNPSPVFRVPHRFVVCSLDHPVECSHCRQEITDLWGVRCEDCNVRAHRHCQGLVSSCVQPMCQGQCPGQTNVPEQAHVAYKRSSLQHMDQNLAPASTNQRKAQHFDEPLAIHRSASTAQLHQSAEGKAASASPNQRNALLGQQHSDSQSMERMSIKNLPVSASCLGQATNQLVAHNQCGPVRGHCCNQTQANDWRSPESEPILKGWVQLKEGGASGTNHISRCYLQVYSGHTEVHSTAANGRPAQIIQHSQVSAVSPISTTTVEMLANGVWLEIDTGLPAFCQKYYSILSSAILPGLPTGGFERVPLAASPSQSAPVSSTDRPMARQPSHAGDTAKPHDRTIGGCLDNDYELYPTQVLGQGQFGVVVGGRERRTGRKVAIKVIDWRHIADSVAAKQDSLHSELGLLMGLDHVGIVSLLQMYTDQNKLYLVMERAQGGDLLERILCLPNKSMGERPVRFYLFQVTTALKYLHDNNIAHRDLKPENILLVDTQEYTLAKLCDFGFARIVGEHSFMQSIVGTPAYVAPEVVQGRLGDGYRFKVDIWSLGVLCYVALSGTFPYNEEEDLALQVSHPSCLFPPKPWAAVAPQAKAWIQKCLDINVVTRVDCDAALNDPWLQGAELRADLQELEQRMNTRLFETLPGM